MLRLTVLVDRKKRRKKTLVYDVDKRNWHMIVMTIQMKNNSNIYKAKWELSAYRPSELIST